MLFGNDVEARQKILVVDDESANLHLLEQSLTDLAEIICSTGGQDALDKAELHQPAIILLDIEMPQMNGFEMCKRLKNNPKTCNSAVIFVTAHSESSFEYKSLSSGGIDFIHKPIDLTTCRLRVKNHLLLKRQEQTIIEARQDMQALVNQIPSYISYWSKDLLNRFHNDYNGKWFGTIPQDALGKPASSLLPKALYEELLTRIASNKLKHQFEITLENKPDKIEYAQAHLTIKKHEGRIAGLLLTLTDITSIKQAKSQLDMENRRLKIMLNTIGDAVIATDSKAKITFINPIAERLTGWVSRDAIGLHIEQVMDLCDAKTKYRSPNPVTIAINEKRNVAMALNCQLTSLDGTIFQIEDSAAPITDSEGEVTGGIMVFHDCSESVAMSLKMSHLANHDQLTDLPNRILLHDRINHACAVADSHDTSVALMLIDIDHFKYLNDSLGHSYGDQVIKQVSKRLQSLIDPSATLGRIGGDEFILLLPSLSATSQVDSIATDIVRSLNTPFRIDDQEYTLSASVGISIYPSDALRPEELMTHVDAAMYRAKDLGRNRFCYFSEDLEQELVKRHELVTLLRNAIDTEAIEVYYQPKVDLKTKQIIGAEALARLYDPNGKLISPLDFIPLAEETGLIHQLGEIILKQSCMAAKAWQDKGKPLQIAVNIAAKQFNNPDFCDSVAKVLELTGLDSSFLELEVTESSLMYDFDEALNVLNTLSSLGLSIAIDDFGTGYSSLSYLKFFPVNTLKIDQSFVKDMLGDEQSLDIVKAVIHLGKSLKLKLIAEGIEDAEQLQKLVSLECEQGQGYMFSKPLPLTEFDQRFIR